MFYLRTSIRYIFSVLFSNGTFSCWFNSSSASCSCSSYKECTWPTKPLPHSLMRHVLSKQSRSAGHQHDQPGSAGSAYWKRNEMIGDGRTQHCATEALPLKKRQHLRVSRVFADISAICMRKRCTVSSRSPTWKKRCLTFSACSLRTKQSFTISHACAHRSRRIVSDCERFHAIPYTSVKLESSSRRTYSAQP